MSSDLQRVAQGLIDALDQNPRAAADLTSAANQCMDLANQVAELAVILPEAAAAEYLAEAARACGEAGQLVAGATSVGRTWAVEAVGGGVSGAGAAPAGRDAAAGNSPRRQERSDAEDDLPAQGPASATVVQRIDLSSNDPDYVPVLSGPPVVPPSPPADIDQPSPSVTLTSGRKGAWNEELNNPAPSTTYVVDSRYSFSTDERGRTIDVKGTLTIGKKDRAEHRQRVAGGTDRKIGLDDGGHVIANRFMGPSEAINVVAQLRNTESRRSPRPRKLERSRATMVRRDVRRPSTERRSVDRHQVSPR